MVILLFLNIAAIIMSTKMQNTFSNQFSIDEKYKIYMQWKFMGYHKIINAKQVFNCVRKEML